MTRLFLILLSVSLVLVSCAPQISVPTVKDTGISASAASGQPSLLARSPVPTIMPTPATAPRLTFTKDYSPGTKDLSGNFMGGTETLKLLAHKGKLYATNGAWTDEPYAQDKLTGPWTGAQLLVKDSYNSPWRLEINFGPNYLRADGSISVSFTTDKDGKPLASPVNLLVVSASDYNDLLAKGTSSVSAWSRDDETGKWDKSDVFRGSGSARSFGNHIDRVTGVHHVFAGLGSGAIYRGAYDPAVPGRLKWDREPELTGMGRVMTFCEANGELFAAAGVKKASPASPIKGGLYKRIDGANPRWELAYQWPFVDEPGDEKEIMRGLTAVPDPNGGGYEVILGTRATPGVVERIDPVKGNSVTVELDIRGYFAKVFGVRSLAGPSLSAYNNMAAWTNPLTGEPLNLIAVWVERPDYQQPPNNGAYYLVRHLNGSYEHGYIYDYASPAPTGQRLKGNRTIEVSPFPEDGGKVLYFGGHDCASAISHNTAWIYRARISE